MINSSLPSKTYIKQITLISFPTRRSSDLSAGGSLRDRVDTGQLPAGPGEHEPGRGPGELGGGGGAGHGAADHVRRLRRLRDRKSTRLNSSHVAISYAVFCL